MLPVPRGFTCGCSKARSAPITFSDRGSPDKTSQARSSGTVESRPRQRFGLVREEPFSAQPPIFPLGEPRPIRGTHPGASCCRPFKRHTKLRPLQAEGRKRETQEKTNLPIPHSAFHIPHPKRRLLPIASLLEPIVPSRPPPRLRSTPQRKRKRLPLQQHTPPRPAPRPCPRPNGNEDRIGPIGKLCTT